MESQVAEAPRVFQTAAVERSHVIYRLALFALLAGSLGLRLFGLGWGIPDFNPSRMPNSAYRNSYHIDEDNYIWGLMQMRPSEGNFDIIDYHWGTLQYFLIYGALLGGEAVGLLPTPWETAFRDGNISAIPRIYELGRLVSVAAGMAGVLVIVALGTLIAGRAAGLSAGLVYSVAPLAVVEAHYLTSDVLVSVFVAAVVLAATLAVRRHKLAFLLLTGFLLGLAITAKYSGIFAAPALLVAQWQLWRATKYRVPSSEYRVPSDQWSVTSDQPQHDTAHRSAVTRYSLLGTRYSVLGTWLLPWLAVIGGFVIGEANALFVPDELLAGVRSTLDGNAMDASWGLEPPFRMITWQLGNLAWLGLTLPVALLALAGIIVMIARHVATLRLKRRQERRPLAEQSLTASPVILLVTIASIIVGLGMNRVFMLRYSQPLVPLLAVAAGIGMSSVGSTTRLPVLRWSAAALALVVAAVVTLGQLSMMAGPHPANELLAWLDSHLKPGQVVARLWPEYPPLDGGDIQLIRLDPWRPSMPAGANPDYIVMDNMQLGPSDPSLTQTIASRYAQVARFSAQPHLGPFTWDEGTTPHDWKYTHPTFIVYARR